MIPWILIGTITGLVIGLTGTGGAVIAVPLFVYFMKLEMAEVTTLALYTVFTGAALNWFFHRKQSIPLLALMMGVFSLLGSLPVAQIKPFLNPWLIRWIFIFICSAGLVSLWWKKRFSKKTDRAGNFTFNSKKLLMLVFGGIFLGIITTLTGLGGGVFLIPFFIFFLRLSVYQAMSNSFLVMMVTSLGSMFAQYPVLHRYFNLMHVSLLVTGCLLSALVLRWITGKLTENQFELLQKSVFTFVVILSLISLVFISESHQ